MIWNRVRISVCLVFLALAAAMPHFFPSLAFPPDSVPQLDTLALLRTCALLAAAVAFAWSRRGRPALRRPADGGDLPLRMEWPIWLGTLAFSGAVVALSLEPEWFQFVTAPRGPLAMASIGGWIGAAVLLGRASKVFGAQSSPVMQPFRRWAGGFATLCGVIAVTQFVPGSLKDAGVWSAFLCTAWFAAGSFATDEFPSVARFRQWAPVLPGRNELLAVTQMAACSYSTWNHMLTQFSFFLGCALLAHGVWHAKSWKERSLFAAGIFSALGLQAVVLFSYPAELPIYFMSGFKAFAASGCAWIYAYRSLHAAKVLDRAAPGAGRSLRLVA